jgi:hypothetical protein
MSATFTGDWATTNYGLTYTSKGVVSIFAGPVAALASVETGKWVGVFWAMILCDVVAAVLALWWLKLLARRTLANAQQTVARTEASRIRLRHSHAEKTRVRANATHCRELKIYRL